MSSYETELIKAVTLEGEYSEHDKEFFKNMIATCSAGNDPTEMMVRMMKDEEVESPAGAKYTPTAPDSWKYIEDVKTDPNRGVEDAIKILTHKIGFNKSTALMIAAKSNNVKMLNKIGQFFMDADRCDLINERDSIGNSALLIVAEKGFTNAVEKLVLLGASLLVENIYGMNALTLAVQTDHPGTVARICDLAGDYLEIEEVPITLQKDKKGEVRFAGNRGQPTWSSKAEQRAFESLLFTYNQAHIETTGKYPLLKLSVDSKLLRLLRSKTDSVNLAALKDQDDASANNNKAAKAGELEIERILQRRCVNGDENAYEISWRNTQTEGEGVKERKPTWHSNTEIYRWIAKAESPENTKDPSTICNEYDIRADNVIRHYLNCRNKYSKSAFLNAVEFSKTKIMQQFLDRKTWAFDDYLKRSLALSENASNVSAIMFGVNTGNIELVKILLDNGAIPENKAIWGENAFHWSSKSLMPEQPAILKLMLERTSARFKQDANKVAAQNAINPDKQNNAGGSILSLLNPGPQVPTLLPPTRNYLMLAASAGNADTVDVLLGFGANPWNNGKEYFKDKDFKSAADYAFEANFFDVAFKLDEQATLNKLRDLFRVKCEATFKIKYISSTSPELGKNTKNAGKFENVFYESCELSKDKTAKANEELMQSTKSSSGKEETIQDHQIYIYTPPNTVDTWHVVQGVKNYTLQQTQMHAFKYYMTRVDQFAHIAKIAAVDDVIFEIFVGMLSNVGNIDTHIQIFLNDVLLNLYEGMKCDTQYDTQILWRITQLYQSLCKCRDLNRQSIKHFFDDELNNLQKVIQRVFDSKEASDKAVVSRLLSKSTNFHKYENDIVEQASVVYDPVVDMALEWEISSLFGVSQVSTFIEKLFTSNLRSKKESKDPNSPKNLSWEFRSYWKHYQSLVNNRHTQGFENIRYCPAVLFFTEGLSKAVLLFFVSYTSVIEYGLFFDSVRTDGDLGAMKLEVIKYWTDFSVLEVLIVIMGFSLFLSEVGQWQGNTMERSKPAKGYFISFYQNFFRDVWNFFDLISLSLLFLWVAYKLTPNGGLTGKTLLAAAAIPQSLGMLRYFSIQKAMGNLVITVISMSRELFAFAIIYTVSIFGFGVTLKALFQTKDASDNWYEGFGTITSTGLTLFDATIGQHDFGQMGQENVYVFYFGLFIEISFLVFTLIILFNLLIAKMTSAYEEKQESALRDWEYARATILRQFLLRGESSPFSMLPPPFNLITAACYPFHWFWINTKMHGKCFYDMGPKTEPKARTADKKCLSLAGVVADMVLCFISAPVMAIAEVVFDVSEMYDIGWKKLEEVEDIRRSSTPFKTYVCNWASVWMLFISHILMVIIASPLTYLYYVGRHFQAVVYTRVYLQFESKTTDNLVIEYASKPSAQVAREDLEHDRFIGLIVRSAFHSTEYLHPNPVICRVICKSASATHEMDDTFKSQTGSCVQLDRADNERVFETFQKNTVKLPLYPMDDGVLIPEMVIQLIEKKPDGDEMVIEKVIHTKRLHEWISNGRFEGELILHDKHVNCVYDPETDTETYCNCDNRTNKKCDCPPENKFTLSWTVKGTNLIIDDKKGHVLDKQTDKEYDLDLSEDVVIVDHQIIRNGPHKPNVSKKEVSVYQYEAEFHLAEKAGKKRLWMGQTHLKELCKENFKQVVCNYWNEIKSEKNVPDANYSPIPDESVFTDNDPKKTGHKIGRSHGYISVAFMFQWDSFSRDYSNAFRGIGSDDSNDVTATAAPAPSAKRQSFKDKKVAPQDGETAFKRAHSSRIDSDGNPTNVKGKTIQSKLSSAYNEHLIESEGGAGSSRFSTRWRQFRVRQKIFTPDEKSTIFDFDENNKVVQNKLDAINALVRTTKAVADQTSLDFHAQFDDTSETNDQVRGRVVVRRK